MWWTETVLFDKIDDQYIRLNSFGLKNLIYYE